MKKILFYILIFTTLVLYADRYANFTSMQGYSGFINIPTADIMEYGEVDFSYSNQKSRSRWWINNQNVDFNPKDYFVNIGFLPHLEFGARVSDIKGGKKDLSVNTKIQLPIKKYISSYLPNIAIGLQDFAGKTGDYKSNYIVISDDVKSLHYSLGYATDSVRMDGFFYGASYSINKYLSFLSEYDTKEKHIGFRLNSPNLFDKFHLSLLAKKNLDRESDRYSIQLNFKFNLMSKIEQKYENIKFKKEDVSQTLIGLYNNQKIKLNDTASQSSSIFIKQTKTLNDLKKELKEEGFEDIKIGKYYSKVFVAYENRVYNQDELDAINKILHILSNYHQFSRFNLVIKKSGVKIKTIDGSLKYYRACIDNPTKFNIELFKQSLIIADDFVPDTIYTIKDKNRAFFKTRIELSPKLKSFLATEVSVYQYYLGLDSTFSWNLYKGIDASLTYTSHIANSSELDEGGVYHSAYEKSHLENAFLHHIFKYNKFINIANIGLYKENYYGILNESGLFIDQNSLKYKFAYFKHKDYDINHDDRKVSLLTFDHYLPSINSIVSVTGGKFWARDIGANIEFKKFFDNTMIYLFYQQSKQDINNQTNKFAGIGFEIPLVPNKIKNNKYFQITGTNAFNHKIKSVVGERENIILPGQLYNPTINYSINNYINNRDRLTKSYIENNIYRIIF